jgi:hypothetical protein
MEAFAKAQRPPPGERCERRSKSDTRRRHRSERRNDSRSVELISVCCRRH